MSPEGLPNSFDELPFYMQRFDALLVEGEISVTEYASRALAAMVHLYGETVMVDMHDFYNIGVIVMVPKTKKRRRKNVSWAMEGF